MRANIYNPKQNDRILCYYVNRSDRVQTIHISQFPDRRFERVVFPKQRLLFEASPTARLEVYRSSVDGGIFLEEISCDTLRVNSGTTASAIDRDRLVASS